MNPQRCLSILALLAVGCGGPGLVPVNGIVELDGQPVENASVLFNGEGGAAYGVTDANGMFRLTTRSPGDGVRPGKYHVGVSKCVQEGGPAVDSNGLEDSTNLKNWKPSGTKHVIPEFFNNPDGSGIVVEVAAGGPPVQLRLRSASK